MNKRKIGTVLEEALFREAKAAAAIEGVPLSALLERALRDYLERHPGRKRKSVVAETWDSIPVDIETLRRVMEEEDGYLDA